MLLWTKRKMLIRDFMVVFQPLIHFHELDSSFLTSWQLARLCWKNCSISRNPPLQALTISYQIRTREELCLLLEKFVPLNACSHAFPAQDVSCIIKPIYRLVKWIADGLHRLGFSGMLQPITSCLRLGQRWPGTAICNLEHDSLNFLR